MGLFDFFRKSDPPLEEPKIVEATFVASAHKDITVAMEIEEAMAQAIKECMARGIDLNQTALIKKAMMNARNRVLNKYKT